MSKQLLAITLFKEDLTLLTKIIEKRKKQLKRLDIKYEDLNKKISTIQSEYEFRIGSLMRKSNLLDQEISLTKSVKKLMGRGLSYEDALLAMQDETRKEKERQEELWEFLELDNEEVVMENIDKKIREVWKKLAQKFHPDLVDDTEEKKRREQMMKLINSAYTKKDYDFLKTIEEKGLLEELAAPSKKSHEKLLVDLENALIRLRKAYELLKKSEWYSWIKKTPDEKEKLFVEFEGDLIREIIRKELMLSDLKRNLK